MVQLHANITDLKIENTLAISQQNAGKKFKHENLKVSHNDPFSPPGHPNHDEGS